MNKKFNRTLITIKGKKPKGFSSEAAKAAFKDVLNNKDMWVRTDDCIGHIEHNEKNSLHTNKNFRIIVWKIF